MATKMKNGNWLGRVRSGKGRRLSETFATKREALAFEAEYTITIGEFFDQVVDARFDGCKQRRSVANGVLKYLDPSTPVIRVNQRIATLLTCELYAAKLKPSTMNTYAAFFNGAMNHAKDLGIIESVPHMKHVKVKNQKLRFLTEEEETRLMAHLRPGDRRIVTLLIYSGMRWSELQNIKPGDYHDGGITLWYTKAGIPRTLPLPQKARAALEEGIEDLKVNYSTFRKRITAAAQKAGLDDVTIHTMRHTTASRMVQRGVDIRRVRDYLGHVDIHTTMRYAHLAQGDLASAADALN